MDTEPSAPDVPAPAEADFGGLRRRLLGLVLNADRRLRSGMEAVLRPYSLSAAEWTALVYVWRDGPISSADLARRVFVSPQAIGQIIGDLERRGILVRTPDPRHGRKLLATVTPAGNELAAQCHDSLRALEDHFLDALDPAAQSQFVEQFAACVEHLKTHPFDVS